MTVETVGYIKQVQISKIEPDNTLFNGHFFSHSHLTTESISNVLVPGVYKYTASYLPMLNILTKWMRKYGICTR